MTADSVRAAGGSGVPRFDALLDDFGRRIVANEFAAGQVLRLEDLGTEFGASRTVLRDVVRVLEAVGMVSSGRRVGITVRPEADWNHLDPRLLGWQLANPETRPGRLLRLSELRYAVEPVAASLMATVATPGERARLVLQAEELERVSARASQDFIETDVAFHAMLLRCSGNDFFRQFEVGFTAALRGRFEHHLVPDPPDTEAVHGHVEVSHAILRGDSAAAEMLLRRVLNEVIERFTPARG